MALQDVLNQQSWNQYSGNSAFGDPNQQGQVQQGLQVFQQSFKNLVGRDPTPEEVNNYAQQSLYGAWNAPGDLGYSDSSNLANNYIQNAFGPQVAQNQQQQQTDQLGKTTGLINYLVGNVTGNAAKLFSDPTSQVYQAFSGSMNNQGITPGSGAFQAGAGSALANTSEQAINNALQTVGVPTIGQIQGLPNQPFNFAQNNSNLGHLNQLNDFGLQSSVASMLANNAQPSTAQKDIGMASGASQALGNLGSAMGPLSTATSYVCKELIKQGLLCEMDMDNFHAHIMPAMFKKGRAFWKYAMDGKRLVDAVNLKGLNWEVFKPLLFDRVMKEPDPCKAVDLYADACHQLCISSNWSLWDNRVYRNSWLDSLLFLPRLLTYKPFLEALWKCILFKLLFVLDRTECEVHRGA